MAKEKVGFDSVLEQGYLVGLEVGRRKKTLEMEVRTAVAERFCVNFSRSYKWEDGRVFDQVSGERVRQVVARSGREVEEIAFMKIESMLGEGRDLVVHMSPENEKHGYDGNVVDFWRLDGGEVKWNRVVVEEGFERMADLFKVLGGKEVIREKDNLLACPVGIDKYSMGQVMAILEVSRAIFNIDEVGVRSVVHRLMQGFYDEFGDKLVKDSGLIFRLFSAAMVEVEKEQGVVWHGGGEVKLRRTEMEDYLWGGMVVERQLTGGCAGVNMVGRFVGVGRGMVISEVDGRVRVEVGSIEGKSYCEKCGCYYEGKECLLCKRGRVI